MGWELISKTLAKATDEYKDEEIELLRRLCTIDCGTCNIEGNSQVISVLSDFFTAANIEHETVDAGKFGRHFVARIRPENPRGKIILNAHIDTVFKPGDTKINEFCIDESGWIHGCGVSDCKGGVVISAFAMRICKELGCLPEYEIAAIYNCDEEVGSPSGKLLLKREAENATCAICFEPSRDEDGILTARMGVGAAHIEVTGKRAHPAMFWNGASATECLVKTLNKLYDEGAKLPNVYYNVTEFDSGPSGCMSPLASCNVGFRVNVDTPYAVSEKLLMSLENDVPVDGCTVKVTCEQRSPVMLHSAENVMLYKYISEIGRKYMNRELPEQTTYGTGDANHLSDYGVPTVCGMGSYMSGPHTLKEKCRADSIPQRTLLTALALAMFNERVFAE